MHRKSRDEQPMIIFVLLARPKWRNFPILQRWCILKHESSKAAQDERTNTIVTVIYLQIFEGASPYTGGRSIISVEMELLCVLYARY